MGKKSVSLVRSVLGFVSLSLLLFTFFRGQATAEEIEGNEYHAGPHSEDQH